jgi:hypothetical protein
MNTAGSDKYTLSIGRQKMLLRQEYWSFYELGCILNNIDPEMMSRAFQEEESSRNSGSESAKQESIVRENFLLDLIDIKRSILRSTSYDSFLPDFNSYLVKMSRKSSRNTLIRLIEDAINETKAEIQILKRSKDLFNADNKEAALNGSIFDLKNVVILFERAKRDVSLVENKINLQITDLDSDLPIIGKTEDLPKIFTRDNLWILNGSGGSIRREGILQSIINTMDYAEQTKSVPRHLCLTLPAHAWCQLFADAGVALPPELTFIKKLRPGLGQKQKAINNLSRELAFLLRAFVYVHGLGKKKSLLWGPNAMHAGQPNIEALRSALLEVAQAIDYQEKCVPGKERLEALICRKSVCEDTPTNSPS